MVKYDIIIGIDPDINKSGVCVLTPNSRSITLDNLAFPALIEFLQKMKSKYDKVNMIVIVEAGWMNEKSCFHKAQGKGGERIAKFVGRNQQTGILLLEMCRYYEIDTEEIKPLTKHWSGKDGKITHKEISYFTGLKKQSNQETRDALLLAWWYAGLPIKVNIINCKK